MTIIAYRHYDDVVYVDPKRELLLAVIDAQNAEAFEFGVTGMGSSVEYITDSIDLSVVITEADVPTVVQQLMQAHGSEYPVRTL